MERDEQWHHAGAELAHRHFPGTLAHAGRIWFGGRAHHFHAHCRKFAEQRLHAGAYQPEKTHGTRL